MYQPLVPELIEGLAQAAGRENVSASPTDLDLHSRDQSMQDGHRPEVVVYGRNVEQIAAVLQFANTHRIPITPWGVGSSLEGNPIPLHGGISLSLEHMSEIVEVHADDFQVTVQAGLGHVDLNEKLARYGLFFPPDPGANATIGGMLANNAAGIRTVKYGATKDNVLRMQVALADGRLIQVGSRSVKQSSGYDLLHLFVGSEGTLGIITEATLKLAPVPEYKSAVLASFKDVESAVQAVVAVRGSGLDPAALEFIDVEFAHMMSQSDGIDLDPAPTLFMEFQAAHQETLQSGLEQVTEICRECGAVTVKASTHPAERKKLWEARHHLYETAVRNHPNQRLYLNDVAVPISTYPEMATYIDRQRQESGMAAYMVGHAGDGNIHVMIPFGDTDEYQRAMALNAAFVKKAIQLGGTATGEHGVGIGKRRYMVEEHGDALDVMRAIKKTLDPNGILNPGKIFP